MSQPSMPKDVFLHKAYLLGTYQTTTSNEGRLHAKTEFKVRHQAQRAYASRRAKAGARPSGYPPSPPRPNTQMPVTPESVDQKLGDILVDVNHRSIFQS